MIDYRARLIHRIETVNGAPSRETYVLADGRGAVQAWRDSVANGEYVYGLAFHRADPDSRPAIGVERDCEWTESGTCFCSEDNRVGVSGVLANLFNQAKSLREYLEDRLEHDRYQAGG